MRILLLLSKVSMTRCSNLKDGEKIILNASLISSLLSKYPEFLGPLCNSELSTLQMYSICLPGTKKKKDLIVCLRQKSDNCRIRTCAGKAQQISSLSP